MLSSPTFGGKKRKTLVASFRVGTTAKVGVAVFRGTKTRKPIKRFKAVTRQAGQLARVRFPSRARRRGMYRVRITVQVPGGERVVRTLYSRLL